jgi:hypothetical protein
VLRFGGAKALTKHIHTPADDSPLNLPSLIDDAKVNPDITDMLDKNVLSICSPHVDLTKTIDNAKPRSTMLQTQSKIEPRTNLQTLKTRIGKIMNKLYDLEPATQPEKPLNIDLGVDLYQMEEL